ncbi:hypothetical protein Poly59_21690 [Rubripirellula reticaptiva]|uniref:Uncharacterized protein n=1 Tax=Rubripirellula reticaptiva TaxID=2528013 RepID=A0A5C6F6Z5_9BACT|nr:hypothetical protein Poly59_21690 [Rubripirellula reticaptiva]
MPQWNEGTVECRNSGMQEQKQLSTAISVQCVNPTLCNKRPSTLLITWIRQSATSFLSVFGFSVVQVVGLSLGSARSGLDRFCLIFAKLVSRSAKTEPRAYWGSPESIADITSTIPCGKFLVKTVDGSCSEGL